jgi:prepilin-type N-terminal cleavage/methylation domain-containing protein
MNRNDKGFSLIELSLVLAMMAILAAFSIPMLSSSMHSMQLISDARSIATTMTYAKLSAKSQMTHCRLSFNLTHNEWSLQRLNKSTGNFQILQDTNGLSSGVANSGIAFKSTSSTAPSGFPTASSTNITFNSRGIPIEGTGIVYLANRNENYAVSASLSGKVQVWRHRNNQWVSQ